MIDFCLLCPRSISTGKKNISGNEKEKKKVRSKHLRRQLNYWGIFKDSECGGSKRLITILVIFSSANARRCAFKDIFIILLLLLEREG